MYIVQNGTCLHIWVKNVDIGHRDGGAFGSLQSIRQIFGGWGGPSPFPGIDFLHKNLIDLGHEPQKLWQSFLVYTFQRSQMFRLMPNILWRYEATKMVTLACESTKHMIFHLR